MNRDKVVKLGRTAVFWGIFVLLLHGGSVVAAPKSNTAEAGMEGRDIPSAGVLAEPEGSLDVIVLGDSEGHSAISPMVLWKEHGITSFVCSQSGQRAVEAYYMLKQVLSVQKPRVVILETDLFYHSREWQREWNLAIERMARYYFPIVQYHNRWKRLTYRDWKGQPFEGVRDANRGFLPSRDIRPYKGGPYMVKTEEREALKGTVTFWMDRLVELCRKAVFREPASEIDSGIGGYDRGFEPETDTSGVAGRGGRRFPERTIFWECRHRSKLHRRLQQ